MELYVKDRDKNGISNLEYRRQGDYVIISKAKNDELYFLAYVEEEGATIATCDFISQLVEYHIKCCIATNYCV
jgi:hypothetical protein